MNIAEAHSYKSSLAACEKVSGKHTFCYGGNNGRQVFPESLIHDAAQDVYNRLVGHGLSYGAIVLILDIVQSQLRFESSSKTL